jgi:hypothetical protein
MRFHPVQHDVRALGKIAKIFRSKMNELDILPKDPWRAKKVEAWLARMGARMKPGSRHYDCFRGREDCSNFVNFKVTCHPRKYRVPSGSPHHRYRLDEPAFMRVEIPWELADKVLALGYLH